jgi:ribosomal protein S27AE
MTFRDIERNLKDPPEALHVLPGINIIAATPKCPKCGAFMVIKRDKKQDTFVWHCQKCKEILPAREKLEG